MVKDILGRLVPTVVNYYFIHNFHVSSSALQHRRQLEFDLTSYAPQQLQIFARPLYNIIMLQNNQNQTEKVQILIRARWSSWQAAGI